MESAWSNRQFNALRLRLHLLLLLQGVLDQLLLDFNFVARPDVGQHHEERDENAEDDAPDQHEVGSGDAAGPHEEPVAEEEEADHDPCADGEPTAHLAAG